ncbi:hypothetical protein BDP27DRAFT_1327425 [Rhodocollybia butyracea]|uniref:DUF6534 domain-containing protein n=1 Tax=Rhodocollybia butyracea TaxID=206335 RepID=A0A9P5PQQ8_9AGAR|nr:hypothetical protein BDP27DRAFT_1327425 [Rhodocollybia butyracea]
MGTFITTGVATSISALIEQIYFLYRLWLITKSKITTIFMSVLIITPFICSLVSINFPSKGISGATICLAALGDSIIAIHLMYTLYRINFLGNSSSAQSLAIKIMAYAVASGTLTAVCTIFMAICTIASIPGGYIILYDCAGRVYTLTVLLNFVFFHEWRRSAQAKHTRDGNNPQMPRGRSTPFTHSSTCKN